MARVVCRGKLTDRFGNVAGSAPVTVKKATDLSAATLYSHLDTTVVLGSNVVMTDSAGNYAFAVENDIDYWVIEAPPGSATYTFKFYASSFASGTVSSIEYVAPAAGLTITGPTPITTTGVWTFALTDDLAALEGLSGTGWVKRTGANAWATSAVIPWADLSGVPGTFPPSAHASTHAAAGGDPVTLAQSQVTDLVADLAAKQPLDTQLTDIAGLAYVGNALKVVRVNAGETQFELAAPSGGGAWGSITGTLSDQTDLQTALDAKQAADTQLTSVAGLTYAGNALKVVRVNAGETDFELAAATGGSPITGEFSLTGVLSPAQITASQNDYAPTNHATNSIWRLDSNATWDITGISGGTSGRILLLVNVGSYTITLKHQSGSSTAGNRFIFPTGGDLALTPNSGVALAYDNTTGRWRPMDQTGTATWSVFDPDAPPSSPSAYDDEFNTAAGTIDNTLWANRPNWSGLTNDDVNTTAPYGLWISDPTTGNVSTHVLRAALQAIPAGDYTIVTKVKVTEVGLNYAQAGLVLSTSATAGAGSQFTVCVSFDSANGGLLWVAHKFTNFNTYSSTVKGGFGAIGSEVYIRIRFVSGTSTIYYGFSTDGSVFNEYSITIATLGYTPTYFGLVSNAHTAAGSNDSQWVFGWFRYSSSASAQFGAVRTYNATTMANVAPADPSFLALGAHAGLTNERVFTPGRGLSAVDSGVGAAYTLNTLMASTAISGTGTLLTTDGPLVSCTGTSYTLNLPTAVGNTGLWYHIVNSGASGTVTVDPNGSQTIGFLTTWELEKGDFVEIYSNGSNWLVKAATYRMRTKLYTANDTFRPPQGCTSVLIMVQGGGGGSGGCSNAASNKGAGGGASGELRTAWCVAVPGTDYAVTIGAGGTAGTTAGTNGGTGGATSVGALLVAGGGAGGTGATGVGANAGGARTTNWGAGGGSTAFGTLSSWPNANSNAGGQGQDTGGSSAGDDCILSFYAVTATATTLKNAGGAGVGGTAGGGGGASFWAAGGNGSTTNGTAGTANTGNGAGAGAAGSGVSRAGQVGGSGLARVTWFQ